MFKKPVQQYLSYNFCDLKSSFTFPFRFRNFLCFLKIYSKIKLWSAFTKDLWYVQTKSVKSFEYKTKMYITMLLCRLTSVAPERKKRLSPVLYSVFFLLSTYLVLSHTFRFIFRVSNLQDIALFFFFSPTEPSKRIFAIHDCAISWIWSSIGFVLLFHTYMQSPPKWMRACAILTLKLHIYTLIGIGLCIL